MRPPKSGRAARVAACALWLAAAGCTTLREISPADYGAEPRRKHVRVYTRDGLVFEFDQAKVEADTLTGYRQRDTEGAFDEYATVRIPLDDIARLSTRTVDWYRTGLIGGGVLAAVVVAGLNKALEDDDPPSSGGGKPIDPSSASRR